MVCFLFFPVRIKDKNPVKVTPTIDPDEAHSRSPCAPARQDLIHRYELSGPRRRNRQSATVGAAIPSINGLRSNRCRHDDMVTETRTAQSW